MLNPPTSLVFWACFIYWKIGAFLFPKIWNLAANDRCECHMITKTHGCDSATVLWAIGWNQPGIFCYLLIYTHHSPGPQVRASGDRTARHTAALCARERPANNLHHYYSSRGQNSLPSIPPPAPKLPSKNDQLPELGATGRNRKIRPNRWLLNASRTEMAVELSLVVCLLVVSLWARDRQSSNLQTKQQIKINKSHSLAKQNHLEQPRPVDDFKQLDLHMLALYLGCSRTHIETRFDYTIANALPHCPINGPIKRGNMQIL